MYRSVLASLLICVVFSVLFVADLQGYFNQASEPIAVLQDADGTIRRLGLNQLTWDRASMGTNFGSGDTIATGEGGRAKLVFVAGGEVTLDEGTMLVLGGSLEELQLNFVSGTGRVRVEKRAASRIKVAQVPAPRAGRAASAGALARPSVARVQIEQVEKLPPVVPAGRTVASAPTEPAQAPKKEFTPAIQEKEIRNTAQVLSTGGEVASVAKLPPAPEVVFPAKDAVFDLTSGSVPKLQWKVATGAEAARDLSFEIILRPAQVVGAESEAGEVKVLRSRDPVLSLSRVSHGKYLWSVRTVAADGRRGPASQARFMEVIVPARIERPRVLPVRVD